MQKIEGIEKVSSFVQKREIEEIKYRLTGKKILFASSLKGEGKTSVALALGRFLAETKKVLYLGELTNEFSTSEACLGQICCSDIDNLYILLKEDVSEEEIDKFGTEFDYVLIEMKALQISKEVMAIAALCDQTILVVEANRGSYRLIKENIELLRAAHAREISLVLNRTKKIYGLLKTKNRKR